MSGVCRTTVLTLREVTFEVFKWQEGFWQIMKEVFDAKYKVFWSILGILTRVACKSSSSARQISYKLVCLCPPQFSLAVAPIRYTQKTELSHQEKTHGELSLSQCLRFLGYLPQLDFSFESRQHLISDATVSD